ncbi:kinase-like protein [Aaosphaeria arxii CBS 175.79]|uniref:Kinase-like protein n=1 Tax=Aaosphaeria arxii CBS 175.79 TaxID=1450172 RepID=A0A6A5XS15_9PLEO|nr:kinase-like protein [Aaosphaeria arxii CBS 175.79]KAF2015733.1 kinase-like protein [Aaosphaeria arxii CBS 175.79]
MEDPEIIEYHYYYPPGVKRVIAVGTSAFIGEVDSSTVLKYPLQPGGDMSRLKHEYRLLSLLGQHSRIIAQKGLTDIGLFLERATNDTIYKYLTEADHRPPTLQQRVAWCREVAEAVEYVHSKDVIHCDIQPTNVLVDKDLHIKLSDFQGNYISENGEIVYGWSGEPCRYFCPRDDEFESTPKTDLFALGSTIYFIMTGHEVFPDIVSGEDGWHEKVISRFASGDFPSDSHAFQKVTQKCWNCRYDSASELLEDIRDIEKPLISGSGH